MTAQEMAGWLKESGQELADQQGPFSVFVDMRTLVPLDRHGRALIMEGQKLYQRRGMERSVVILKNPVTTMQFKQIAIDSGIYDYERYIDASATENWEKAGLDWILYGIDPDRSEEEPAGYSSSEESRSAFRSALNFFKQSK